MNKDEHNRLSQNGKLEKLRRKHQLTDMLTVYMSDSGDGYYRGIFGVLVPIEKISDVLSDPHWNFHYEEGAPSFIHHNDKERTVQYLRYGNTGGFEPLVINRNFWGLRPNYEEVNEEFRLFHRLYHDPKTNVFTKIDSKGNEQLVIEVRNNIIKVRLKEICEFLTVKEMFLSLQFDFCECSHYSSQDQDVGIEPGIHQYQEAENLLSWGLAYSDIPDTKWKSASSLRGKKLFMPLSKPKRNIFDLEERRGKYVDFIIGVDDVGNSIDFTSDPDKLANFFGANPDSPHYLTPVYFSKEVLDKYYQKPGKYSVEPSILRCGALWALVMDNNHEDKVCAWLGDLGRGLPYEEQLHWRSYNMQPRGELSNKFIKNQLLNQPANPDRPEFLFRKSYDKLRADSERLLGWPILLPLGLEDSHHLRTLRVPASSERREFDELILSMTKILVDSINKNELMKLIPGENRDRGNGSIRILEMFCENLGIKEFDHHILYLRKLQDLRSSGSAHRKGKNYAKAAKQFDLENRDLGIVFSEILRQGVEVLDFLSAMVSGGGMNAREEQSLGLPSKRESVFTETLPEDVFGSVAWDGPPVSLEDMKSGVLEEARRRDEGA